MGGRGGKGGTGPGTGSRNNGGKGAGGSGSTGSSGGGGSSSGSSGGGKGTGSAGTGGVTGGGGGGSGGGGSSTTTPAGSKRVAIKFGEGLTDTEKATQQSKIDKLPDHVSKRLAETGTEVWVGTRADETPGWHSFSKYTGLDSNTKIGDGREMGSLSFYVPSTNQLFISVHHPGGSVNVYTHELGHAVDYQWTGTSTISRDPDWVKLHTDKILNNPNIDSYFRGGPTGTDPVSGRAELFAEGFAIFNEYGRGALVGWVKDEATADEMIRIWKKYGVFK